MKIFSLEELEKETNKVDQTCVLSSGQQFNILGINKSKIVHLEKRFQTSHPKGNFQNSYNIYG
jgi:hypothetical protein